MTLVVSLDDFDPAVVDSPPTTLACEPLPLTLDGGVDAGCRRGTLRLFAPLVFACPHDGLALRCLLGCVTVGHARRREADFGRRAEWRGAAAEARES